MGHKHTALLPLPDLFRAEGINVVELDGWEENEQGYYWTRYNESGQAVHDGYNGVPNGWLWHHTASSGYTPFVKNSRGQTKACLWMGLMPEGSDRLYQAGEGVPTVVFASAGPADYSNGSGVRKLLDDFVVKDERFYGPQRQSDDDPKWYGNRFYGATEIVHRGDGSEADQGVFRMVYIAMAVMMRHFGWSAWRHAGHLDHSRRKIDPRFEQGSPYTIGFLQDVAQGYEAGIVTPPSGGIPVGECPWTNNTDKDADWYDGKVDHNGAKRGPCTNHFDLGMPIAWGVNTGMCNVPKQQEAGIIKTAGDLWYPSDNGRDMYRELMEYGRALIIIDRATS